jgi:2-oxoisovalerate dehydrogenase E1 component
MSAEAVGRPASLHAAHAPLPGPPRRRPGPPPLPAPVPGGLPPGFSTGFDTGLDSAREPRPQPNPEPRTVSGPSQAAGPAPDPGPSQEAGPAPDPGPGPGPAPSPAVTRIDLVTPGPGDELVSHVDAVLTELRDPQEQPYDTSPKDEDAEKLLRLFDAMAGSRWLDVAARRLHALGVGDGTTASTGHEVNAAVALAVRTTDPALPYLRSGAFYLARRAQERRTNTLSSGVGRGLLDIALGLVESSRQPIAGGRHKTFGHPDLAVIPQTSTGAGHLPRAVGIAWSLGRQERLPDRLRVPLAWPDDALVVVNFDDAAANHSTALGAINAACWTAHQKVSLPLLMVCEDTMSCHGARTPSNWVAARFSACPGLEYRYDDGSDPRACLTVAAEAARDARTKRVPVLLHLRCSPRGERDAPDAEPSSRTAAPADGGRDLLTTTMRVLVADGVLSAEAVRKRWASIRDEVSACVEEALRAPRLEGAVEVMAPLAPRRADDVARNAVRAASDSERARVFGNRLPEAEGGLTLAQSLNRALLDAGALRPELLVLGRDVGRAGGAHRITHGLQRRLGASRVIDTLPDERTILGMSLGAGVSGLLPVPEIEHVAGLHDAQDQLRAEAAALQFFSQGAYRNPLVIRVPGLAHDVRRGGHVDDATAIGVLRDIPGIVVACPAHPSDAPALLRTCLAAAETDGSVCVVLEPVALYHEQDMTGPGDGMWLAPYTPPDLWGLQHIPVGQAATWGNGEDLTVATFGNGVRMSLRVAARLSRDGIGVRVVDLRWLAPLPVEDVVRQAGATGRCLVVDETRRSCGISEALITGLLEGGFTGRLARLAADDTIVPVGDAARYVLLGEDDIEEAARELIV